MVELIDKQITIFLKIWLLDLSNLEQTLPDAKLIVALWFASLLGICVNKQSIFLQVTYLLYLQT